MKLVVWDLIQTGTYATSVQEKDTSKKKLNTMYLAETLKIYNISKDDFFKSFNFYQSHPVLNQELFDSVNSYAERQRGDFYKKHKM